MTRDYSHFLPPAPTGTPSEKTLSTLDQLGWRPFFSQQVADADLSRTPPVRVTEVHRSGLRLRGEGLDTSIPPGVDATVGDWLLLDALAPLRCRVLQRSSLFQRRAAGHDRRRQLIAANVDTVFIVSSCNQDFNVARLERYVAMALDAGAVPVIVLTKTDICEDPDAYVQAALKVSDRAAVRALNAKGPEAVAALSDWCAPGQTVAFMGSSGVGKTTLVNAFFAAEVAETGAIREADGKGRHTTTYRQLHLVPGGCAVLDTPGMRELQLIDVETGIAELFDDLVALAGQCRFNDCAHESEPGCAIRAALEDGRVDAVRLARWRKLANEERFNASTLSQRRAFDKARHKMYKTMKYKPKW